MKIEAFTGTAGARILCVAGELFSLSKNDCVVFAYLCKGTFLRFVNIEEREINPKSSDIFDALKSDKKKAMARREAGRGVSGLGLRNVAKKRTRKKSKEFGYF